MPPRLPLAVYYEHPDWFGPLFRELDRRGVPYVRLHAGEHGLDPGGPRPPYGLVLNRMSPSAYLRGLGSALFYTSHFLAHLRRQGVPVINGEEAWRTEISKVRQLGLLASLGLPHPRARAIHRVEAAPRAAGELRFPLVVKPNVGGSGAGIRRFDEPEELESAVREDSLDLGPDGTALVQEFVPPAEGRIVRVEVLGGRFLYAIRVYTPGDAFNLCPADICRGVDGAALERTACPADAADAGLRVEGFEPPTEVVRQVERITRAAGIHVGGVEYLEDARDGARYFYDVNALSNFVADAPRVVGFDPHARMADWLEELNPEELDLRGDPAPLPASVQGVA